MRSSTRILAIIVLMLGFLVLSQHTKAQNVVRNGNVFVQSSTSGDSTKTDYEYQDRDGNKYTIYLSSKGKAYVWMKSKKTGKMYKRYLPKITQMLQEMEKDGRKQDYFYMFNNIYNYWWIINNWRYNIIKCSCNDKWWILSINVFYIV